MQKTLVESNCSRMQVNPRFPDMQNLQTTKQQVIQDKILKNQQEENEEQKQEKILQLTLESCIYDMCINPDDPEFAKKIQSVKLNQCVQIPFIIATIILLGSFAAVIVGFRLCRLDALHSCGILAFSYYLYLIISIKHNNFSHYMSNLKSFDHYRLYYKTATSNFGHFQLIANSSPALICGFIFSTRIRYQAIEKCYPENSQDLSQGIEDIEKCRKFVFIRFYKRFIFADQDSRSNFWKKQEQIFKRYPPNEQKKQENLVRFQIDDFQESELGFSDSENQCLLKVLFYFFTFLGLALPYSLIFERFVDRYEIKIVKKLIYEK